jgi:hypothetical protein
VYAANLILETHTLMGRAMAVRQKPRGAKRKPAFTAAPRNSAATREALRSGAEDKVDLAQLPELGAEFDEQTLELVKSLLLKARIAELDDPEAHLAYIRSRIGRI